MATGFSVFVLAIKAHCMTACRREWCGGCPFEPWSERKREIRRTRRRTVIPFVPKAAHR